MRKLCVRPKWVVLYCVDAETTKLCSGPARLIKCFLTIPFKSLHGDMVSDMVNTYLRNFRKKLAETNITPKEIIAAFQIDETSLLSIRHVK